MKYDCTKTEDFFHEIGRMFVETNRYGSKIEDLKYRVVDSNGKIHNATRIQENIKWVQKWSDAHPERTNKDVFMERYLNAPVHKIVKSYWNCNSITVKRNVSRSRNEWCRLQNREVKK